MGVSESEGVKGSERGRARRAAHVVRVGCVPHRVGAAQQHLERDVGHALAQQLQTAPGALAQEAQRHVVRRAAPPAGSPRVSAPPPQGGRGERERGREREREREIDRERGQAPCFNGAKRGGGAHISKAYARLSAWLVSGAAASRSWVRIRVARRLWWASLHVVSHSSSCGWRRTAAANPAGPSRSSTSRQPGGGGPGGTARGAGSSRTARGPVAPGWSGPLTATSAKYSSSREARLGESPGPPSNTNSSGWSPMNAVVAWRGHSSGNRANGVWVGARKLVHSGREAGAFLRASPRRKTGWESTLTRNGRLVLTPLTRNSVSARYIFCTHARYVAPLVTTFTSSES